MDGVILKALSGFYYVLTSSGETVACRARGKFRHQHVTPLVGDKVEITCLEDGSGMVDAIRPRRNAFSRPAVANIDQLVIVASAAAPVTDPFLIDRAASLAEGRGCEPVVVFNKCDLLEPAEELFRLYQAAGFTALRVSAATGEGIEELRAALDGKVSAFTGNTGVGKSSLLNALQPDLALPVGEISEKLGRGRHTTRHVELLRLGSGVIADTPGFSSLESDPAELGPKEALAATFREFRPFLEDCRFVGCSHVKEKGCAVRAAVKAGTIAKSRHESYVRLYQQLKELKEWESQR